MVSRSLFIDTGAFYAFVDKKDAEHQKIAAILNNRTESFFTSNYIVDELITLFRFRRIVFEQFSPFIDALLNEEICNLFRVTSEIDRQDWELMKKYKDHDFSFTDCTSFVLMQNYGMKKVCSLDSHFQIMGFDVYTKP